MSDNEFKRQKALRKMQEEIKDRETMEKDIKSVNEEIDQLQKRKQDIEQQLSKIVIDCISLIMLRI